MYLDCRLNRYERSAGDSKELEGVHTKTRPPVSLQISPLPYPLDATPVMPKKPLATSTTIDSHRSVAPKDSLKPDSLLHNRPWLVPMSMPLYRANSYLGGNTYPLHRRNPLHRRLDPSTMPHIFQRRPQIFIALLPLDGLPLSLVLAMPVLSKLLISTNCRQTAVHRIYRI